MKPFFLSFMLLTVFYTSAQENRFPLFSEFSASVNHTAVSNENTTDRWGFGLGVYHSWKDEEKINILAGIEYNYTSQFKKYLYEGRYGYSRDITYSMNYLSLPVTVRLNAGNSVKVFLETGLYVDLLIQAKQAGTKYITDSNNPGQTVSNSFDERVGLAILNPGFSIGAGIRMPVGKYEVMLKPEYKAGLRGVGNFYSEEIYNNYVRLMVRMKIK